MTVFEGFRNQHILLAKLFEVGNELHNNSMRIISLYNEYIEKYGDYDHMSREQRFSANLLPSFDKAKSMGERLESVALVVSTYSLANNYTVYESVRFSLNHWRELPSVTDEEIDKLICAFEQRIKEKNISPSIIIDPFDNVHSNL